MTHSRSNSDFCHQNQSSLCSKLCFSTFFLHLKIFVEGFSEERFKESQGASIMFFKNYASDFILTSKFFIWIAILDLRVTKGHSSEAVGVRQTWAYILVL